MKLKFALGVILALLVVIGGWWYLTSHAGDREAQPSQDEPSTHANTNRAPKDLVRPGTTPLQAVTNADSVPAATNTVATQDAAAPRLSLEEALVQQMEELLLDAEDHAGALRLARQLMRSQDPEVRSEVVDTLDWIGLKALPELTSMLADSDPEVAMAALSAWLDALDDVESPLARAELLNEAIPLVRNEDDLQELLIATTDLPDGLLVRMYIDILERTADNPVVNEAIREEYEATTGDPFISREAAERWILANPDDPDDYQVDEALLPAPVPNPGEI